MDSRPDRHDRALSVIPLPLVVAGDKSIGRRCRYNERPSKQHAHSGAGADTNAQATFLRLRQTPPTEAQS